MIKNLIFLFNFFYKLIKKTMLELFMKPDLIECGIDEVGAGCLSGPVTISAVIWPNCFDSGYRDMLELIKDSKKLSEKKRYFLRDFIQEHALAYSIIDIDNNKIDEINILQARLIGFHKAIDELDIIPEHIIVDGDKFRIYTDKTGNVVQDTKVLDGDNKYQSIASAAMATLVSFAIYNVLRTILVKVKLNLLPFSKQYFYAIPFIFIPFLIEYYLIPSEINIWLKMLIDSSLVVILFCLPVYFLKISGDINEIVNTLLRKYLKLKI